MPSALSGMRIIALPLTRAIPSPQACSRALPLTYYHFQTPPPTKDHKGKEGIMKKVTMKAADIWAGFGKAPENNWKRRIFVYGEKLVDRVDFEELSLKGIDPSLGPRIGQVREEAEKVNSLVKIHLLYPPSCDFGNGVGLSPIPHIRTLLTKRTPHHKKGFYMWMGIAPLTAPLALIPIVPNLPFFYAAWRAWSHYRAWKASQYLEGLIDSNHILPQPSSALEEIYTSFRYPFQSTEDFTTPVAEKDVDANFQPNLHPRQSLLLDQAAIPRILETFQLPHSAGAAILRAIEQAKVRVQNDKLH